MLGIEHFSPIWASSRSGLTKRSRCKLQLSDASCPCSSPIAGLLCLSPAHGGRTDNVGSNNHDTNVPTVMQRNTHALNEKMHSYVVGSFYRSQTEANILRSSSDNSLSTLVMERASTTQGCKQLRAIRQVVPVKPLKDLFLNLYIEISVPLPSLQLRREEALC